MSLPSLELGRAYRIDEIVAHTDRMSLLEEVIAYDEQHIVVALTIRESTEFLEAGKGVPAWVGIEYMAQAVGAFSGIEEVQAGLKPQIGLLLGSRKYQSTVDYFLLGERLLVTANLLLRDESNLVAFKCEIQIDERVVAKADLKAIRPDDVHALVQSQS